ncbi:hypothetical protein conserved [Leishmania donovani]|uniref:Hypothetical_protein_conserved n=1 Tax=Leishmania donovani TaxID=5661 RepID=A0A6J8FM39_LEIDO|nr:hypothetical protein conserved [Leishmania donovani]VDZ48798.1 hypothetical_protein_conserved [Leishmania donovani]
MQHSSYGASLPDALVRAIRAASKPFFQIQASRYAQEANSRSDLGFVSLVMKTKALVPQEKFDSSHLLPSAWSELYRTAVKELADADAKELWGLVSVVLRVVEQGAVDCVNASAAIVEWHSWFDDELADAGAVIRQLQCEDPHADSDVVVEELGSNVLGRIEGAFLTGHFHAAASLMDALLLYLRRGGSALLTAEVETALANVKRLLTVTFHDPVSHRQWVETANDELQDSRITLLTASRGSQSGNDNGSGSSAGGATVMDKLVEDLCAASLDILLLITKDAKRMCDRCLDSHRTATDFLVAVCAIMEPYAGLQRVYSLFAKYVDDWDNTDGRQWYYECVLAILGVGSVVDMVAAMHEVAMIVAETFPQAAAVSSTISDEDAYDCDKDDADEVSDTVSLDAVTAAAKPPSAATTRRFMLTCMTAHIADLCAPAVVSTSAADIHLTFCRNELVTAYARLFAMHPRTWRIAGLYACYSPLNDPLFLSEIVLAVAPAAAADETVYRSLRAFFHTTWSTSSDHQQAVRAKLEAALPEHAAVAKWWSAMEYYYSQSYRDAHRHIIMTQLNSGNCVSAVWLAVQTQLTEVIESELRRQLKSKDALGNAQLYTVGSAVQNGFVAVGACANMELGRYLCAAAAFSAYRQAATAADASLAMLAQGQPSSLQPSRSPSRKFEFALAAAATCLQTIESALKSVVECHAMVHPSTIFTLVEHGTSLLLSLRQLMRVPGTGESTGSAHVSSCVLPLLIESYELASIHNVHHDPNLADRSRALAEQLAHVHQTSI